MDSNYRYYSNPQQHESHDVIFKRSAAIIEEIRDVLASKEEDLVNVYADFTVESMAHLIFGSNMQEKAGMGLDQTIKLCHRVFAGEDVDPENYQQHVIRSRREVIQHAKALKHITDKALLEDEQLSDQLIQDTHRILCENIAIKGDEEGHYAGRYREINVMAGNTAFCHPDTIRYHMNIFIDDFNKDIENRDHTKHLDPFYLAADVCQDFVLIHPFRDGNGRMCRLLANAFLIKYAGIVISIGEHDEDRKQYLDIAMMAGEPEREEEALGTLGGFFLEKADRTLRELKERLQETRRGLDSVSHTKK
ncbi:fido domain-containing protein [Cadophora sp. MPI-SDFR-AT-0126]|nr:fido domain-containing protein [Leotiomycetes sp. MPI-SDFR-AT-0126]